MIWFNVFSVVCATNWIDTKNSIVLLQITPFLMDCLIWWGRLIDVQWKIKLRRGTPNLDGARLASYPGQLITLGAMQREEGAWPGYKASHCHHIYSASHTYKWLT
jgi:hypothetical protein